MISAVGLTRRFGSQVVLDRLDLAVAEGEKVALLGLNGAGKTTLFRCLLGLLPYEGDLRVADADVRRAGPEHRAAVGYVPQRPPQFDGTLADLVRFFAGLRGVAPEVVGERMAELDLSLDLHGEKPVRALSGGMLQKTLLALAIAAESPVLLLDEPTANLDPRARAEFVRGLKRVPARTTVILSSHRLEDIRAAADRVAVLHGGRIVFDGTLPALHDAAAVAPTLWVEAAAADRESLAVGLRNDRRILELQRNGVAVGLRVRARDLGDVLVAVRGLGVEVSNVRIESPALEELLQEHTGPGGSTESHRQPARTREVAR